MEEKSDAEITKSVEEMAEKVKDIINMDEIESLVQKNIIDFKIKDIEYRIKKPTFEQKSELNSKRLKKYIELLKDDTNLLEEDLIKIYQKRGIDIRGMQKEVEAIDKKKKNLQFDLGKALKDKEPDNRLKSMRDEIDVLRQEQEKLLMKVATLLDASIESQMNIFVITYLGYEITEKKEGENWVKAWKSYDDFIKEEDDVINHVTWYTSILSKSDISFGF